MIGIPRGGALKDQMGVLLKIPSMGGGIDILQNYKIKTLFYGINKITSNDQQKSAI